MAVAGFSGVASLDAHLLPAGGLRQVVVGVIGGGEHGLNQLLLLPLLHKAGGALGNLNALPAALAVAEDLDLTGPVGLQILRPAVQADLHPLPQQLHALHVARPVGGLDEGLQLGHPLGGVLIGVLFVLEAAHQPPAGAGDLGGVQAQILGLGHLDGNRHKPVQKLGAAEGPPADAKAPDHLRLVPDADLPELNPRPEDRSQIPDQLPEVHPPVGGEIEHDLVAVKAHGDVDQLHLQAVVGDFALADVKGVPLPLPVVFHHPEVVFRGPADNGAEGLDDGLVRHLVIPLGAGGKLQALGGLDDDILPHADLDALGVEEIGLAAAPKADADDFSQNNSSNSAARAPSTWPGPTL